MSGVPLASCGGAAILVSLRNWSCSRMTGSSPGWESPKWREDLSDEDASFIADTIVCDIDRAREDQLEV